MSDIFPGVLADADGPVASAPGACGATELAAVSLTTRGGARALELAQFVEEAQKHLPFRQLWTGDGGATFRPFVCAALRLAGLSELTDSGRRAFYAELATGNRADLLDRVSGLPGWKRCMRLLPKTDYESFGEHDWNGLHRVTESARTRRALGHLDVISTLLIRQLSKAPEALRIPAILRVMNTLDVSEANWRRLAAAFEDAPPQIRSSLLAKAGKVKSFGSFWDFFHACLERPWRPFDLPPQFLNSAMLRSLRTRKDLEREGKRMNNCLANEVAEVREGRRAYFRWLGPNPATVQLLRSTCRWHLGPILGPHNRPLSSSEAEPIVGHAEDLIAAAGSDLSPPREDSISAIVSLGETARQSFSARELDRVVTALRNIHRKSKGPGPETNAYCILEALHGYIQFMDFDGSGELLCEIQSHRFSETLDGSMTNDIVDLIERAGFSWPAPHAEQNFVRRIPIRSDLEIDSLAGFALGVLAEVFGFRSGKALAVKVHLP